MIQKKYGEFLLNFFILNNNYDNMGKLYTFRENYKKKVFFYRIFLKNT